MKQILYIAHGGGPMPLLDEMMGEVMGDKSHESMNQALREAAQTMPKPSASICSPTGPKHHTHVLLANLANRKQLWHAHMPYIFW